MASNHAGFWFGGMRKGELPGDLKGIEYLPFGGFPLVRKKHEFKIITYIYNVCM